MSNGDNKTTDLAKTDRKTNRKTDRQIDNSDLYIDIHYIDIEERWSNNMY